MSVLNWIWLWWDAASWLRIPSVLKIDSWEKLLNMIKKTLKMELKYWNWDYKRWPLIISRVIRIACILIRTLIPHKYSFEFCLGFWTMKIPTPGKNENIFYLYGSPKMNLSTFWTSWECIKVLKIGYTSWKSRKFWLIFRLWLRAHFDLLNIRIWRWSLVTYL